MTPSNKIQLLLGDILERLRELRCHFALVGGVAVSTRTEPRFTKDVDFAIAVASAEERDELVRLLTYRTNYRKGTTLERMDRDEVATVRFLSPLSDSDTPDIDLIFASSGIEREVVERATLELVAGHELPVATIPDLLVMKLVAVNEDRDKDPGDIKSLIQRATDDELQQVRDTLDLVTERGYHQGKDLQAEFDARLELAKRKDLTFREIEPPDRDDDFEPER